MIFPAEYCYIVINKHKNVTNCIQSNLTGVCIFQKRIHISRVQVQSLVDAVIRDSFFHLYINDFFLHQRFQFIVILLSRGSAR